MEIITVLIDSKIAEKAAKIRAEYNNLKAIDAFNL